MSRPPALVRFALGPFFPSHLPDRHGRETAIDRRSLTVGRKEFEDPSNRAAGLTTESGRPPASGPSRTGGGNSPAPSRSDRAPGRGRGVISRNPFNEDRDRTESD